MAAAAAGTGHNAGAPGRGRPQGFLHRARGARPRRVGEPCRRGMAAGGSCELPRDRAGAAAHPVPRRDDHDAAVASAGGIALAQCLYMLRVSSWRRHGRRGTPISCRSPAPVFSRPRVLSRRQDFVGCAGGRSDEPRPRCRLAASIRPDAATRSERSTEMPAPAGTSTTHLSVIDSAGNRVAATLTINLLFGPAVARGTACCSTTKCIFTLERSCRTFRLRGGAATRSRRENARCPA